MIKAGSLGLDISKIYLTASSRAFSMQEGPNFRLMTKFIFNRFILIWCVIQTLTLITLFVKFRSPSQGEPWKQQAKMKKVDDSELIAWAGEHHRRTNFRKTKDNIGDWTNVLFRAWASSEWEGAMDIGPDRSYALWDMNDRNSWEWCRV